MIQLSHNDTPMLVLAGGFGTRLRSAVPDLPKALAPVEGKPFLSYILESWIEQGQRSFIFLLYYKADAIIEFLCQFQRAHKVPLSFDWVVEKEALGTGGSVANAIAEKNLSGHLLVSNADTWLRTGLREILAAPAPALLACELENTQRYGRLSIANGRVVEFLEKSAIAGRGWVNAGLYRLHTDDFKDAPRGAFSIEGQVFPRLCQTSGLNAAVIKESFIDIGIPDDYHRFIETIGKKL